MTNILCAAILLTASWERFSDEGKIAANGHKFSPSAMSCATWRFPIGTKLRVTDSHNGLSTIVTVTDRTARKYTNRIDLSPAAFQKLNGLALGACAVSVQPR